MLRQSLIARSIHLKDSYIAISKYVRCGHARVPNRQFYCPHDPARRSGTSTTHSNPFSTLRNLKDRPRIPQDADITQGFPEPPESGSAPSTSEGNGKAEAPTPHQPSEESLPSDPGPDIPIRQVLSKNFESPRPKKDNASAPSHEDLMGTEGDHDGKGGIHYSSGQYKYMGRAISTALLFKS
jgi:hypothetical protein